MLHLFNLSHTLKKASALKYIYMIFKVLFLPITSFDLQSKPVSWEEQKNHPHFMEEEAEA